jgi:hypothetical protein
MTRPLIFAVVMARRFLTVVLAASMLGQASVRTVLLLHYQWNREAYVQRCENVAKPELDCQGKCYLKKKMMAVEGHQSDSRQPFPAFFFSWKDLSLFWKDEEGGAFSELRESGVALLFPPCGGSPRAGCTNSVFHPPPC